jgi:hypothetical protein
MRGGGLSFARIFGMAFVVFGIAAIYVLMPLAFPFGPAVTLLAGWLLIVAILVGCFMIAGIGLRSYVRTLLASGLLVVFVGLVFTFSPSLISAIVVIDIFLLVFLLANTKYVKRKLKKAAENT